MKLTLRTVVPLLFAAVLLFAQQGSALHGLRHAFAEQTQQQDKQAPHANDCEQCTSYSQLGSAINNGDISFKLHASPAGIFAQNYAAFITRHTLPATARGPPSAAFKSS
jgi:hypothetical protein